MLQRDENILRKIVSEIGILEEMLGPLSGDDFVEDEVIKRSSAMCAINIGELAKHISDSFHEDHPGNELKMAAKTRDWYAHGYYSLSYERVYETAKDDYPRLKAWIEDVLAKEAVDGQPIP